VIDRLPDGPGNKDISFNLTWTRDLGFEDWAKQYFRKNRPTLITWGKKRWNLHGGRCEL